MKACLTTKPMYCSREYFKTSRLIQQYEKSTPNYTWYLSYAEGDRYREWFGTSLSTNMTILQSNREPIVCPVISNGENKIWGTTSYLLK